MQVSEHYGFSQNITDLTLDNAVAAVRTEMIGQTFAVLGQYYPKPQEEDKAWSMGS